MSSTDSSGATPSKAGTQTDTKTEKAAPNLNGAGKRKSRPAAKSKKPRAAKGIRPFPKVPLSKALEVGQKIKELNGGNPWTPAQVAEAIEMGARSPDFYYVTAASRDFGLTTGSRDTDTIALTELGREILYAPI